ncbi:hypothetical protein CANARDRAFT_175128 [[Candida] arabinofermentans NRRL YB-2248]|uniref:Actin-related protein 2/3 complex subunit n=1 Tax=[Candida] arabinofermentans NRRL YB-2248 TaxID=983967 RepID=A0A1E4T376_9ASCO|nr:hypothetical protein CANARDRAFT_175128 [[Candida] arabinofermentans NRRL YB-2248]
MSPIQFTLSKGPIYSHCFSSNKKFVAITKENNVEIYDLSIVGNPKLITILKHHDKTITALDINSDGLIVTCSQDRNALVWEPTSSGDGEYKPTLVLLRINRAATTVKWSPNGKKFAVGSSARVIAICYFELENDWWISKHIKKPLKSTILSLDWHENSVLLSCGSSDGHVRVFSTFIKSVDSKPTPTIWGERLPFQTLCLDCKIGSWIHDVKFDPNYQFLSCIGHDSTINFIYPGVGDLEIENLIKLKTSNLPFKSILFINEMKVVVGGYDCYPIVYEFDGSKWFKSYSIDDPSTKNQINNENQSALNMFRQMDLKGKNDTVSSALLTIHQNTINELRPFQSDSNGILRFSSCGNDGKIVIFDV